MLKTFYVSDLKPGMMVSKVLSQHGAVKIRKVGIIRSPEMVKGLKEMGVTEVEVDLSQSFGLIDDEVEPNVTTEVKKLTPTQQLLKNERQSAKQNNVPNQQFNRSLFMPSVDSMPSSWSLYGKNIALLSLLVAGGFCIGWNIIKVPVWLSLIQDKNYTEIDYQPLKKRTLSSAADLSSSTKNIAQSASNIDNEQQNLAPKNAELLSADNIISSEVNRADQSEQASTEIEPVAEQAPLVLGYQPDNRIRSLNPIRNLNSQNQNLLAEPQASENESAVSADLISKINKAIAELDDESNGDISASQTNKFEDLPRIDQLSVALQTQLPSMAFNAHMYSSNRDGRWVRVNGRRLIEGDYIAEELQLINIEPQTVILMFKGEVFTMSALTDW